MCLKCLLTGGFMDFKTLIKFLPLIGIVVGLLIGDQTRPTILFAKIPFFELFKGLSSSISSDQKIAKDQTHACRPLKKGVLYMRIFISILTII